MPGVSAVLTAADVPGANAVGLEHLDQPALADGVVRYQGEPVALVAADHPETARRAAKRIVVDYEVLPAVTDPRQRTGRGRAAGARRTATWCARCRSAAATRRPPRPSSWRSTSRSACRTRPSSAPSPGSPCPAEDGGIDLYVATQWLHVDQTQVCRVLGMPPEQVRLHLAGRRRRVRRPRGPLDARPRLPARAAHRQAGEDELLPRGVVLRARAPAPGVAALRVRRRARTARSSTRRPTSSSTAAPTPPRRARWSATAAPSGSARTGSRTCTSTRAASTRTTRRAARCAGSAACRPRSRTRR